jgi:putative membrane-bound dehydrogenase-like protein
MKPLNRPIFAFFASCALNAQQPAEQQPTIVPVTAFTVPEGMEVQVWATSPLLYNPTNMDVDQHGRIWVTEGVNYRGKAKRRKEGDRVVVLEDTNHDGKADKSTVFVQEEFFVSPLGIAVFDNKIIVSQPPDMIVYTDVDRNLKFDPKVDKREVLLTGFQGRNHDHSLHSITAGPDGKWYWNSGNCGAVFTDKSGKTFRITSSYMDPKGVRGQKSDDGHVYVGGFTARMDPDGSNVEIIGHNYRNSYEQIVTSFGDVFQSDNDDPPACRVSHVIEYGNAGFSSRDGKRNWRADQRRGQDTPTAEWRQDDPGTMPPGDVYGGGSPTGVAFYENGALGKKWRGLLLTCEPARNVVFGYLPVRDGAGFKLARMDWMTCNPEHKFNGGDFSGRWDGKLNTQFRPSDVTVGVDGAIYVADWFDGRVGGHQTLDNSLSGTIYRIAPKGFVSKVPKIVDHDLKPSEVTEATFDDVTNGIITALRSPATNVRHLGLRRLQEGHIANPLHVSPEGETNPFVQARLYWLLPLLGEHGVYMTEMTAIQKGEPQLRIAAFRALKAAGKVSQKLTAVLCKAKAPFLRAAVATSLRDAPAADSVNNLVEIARRFDGKDRSYLDAFGIGCTGKESQVYAALAKDANQDPTKWTQAMAWIAWRLGAPESVPALVARVKSTALTLEQRTHSLTAIAFIKDKVAMAAMVAIADDFDCSLTNEALLWCIKRMGNEWKEFGLAEILKENGMYDPDAITIQPIATPEAPAKQTITVAQVLKLQGNAKAGATKPGTCYTCHKIGVQGIEFGPDIVSFAKAQSTQAIAEAILHPSKTISHGYEGHSVETAEGNVEGIVLSRGNPVMVQSQGGILQMIPKSRVKKIHRLPKSLMWPSQLNGLDAQGIADLIAYLKSL